MEMLQGLGWRCCRCGQKAEFGMEMLQMEQEQPLRRESEASMRIWKVLNRLRGAGRLFPMADVLLRL